MTKEQLLKQMLEEYIQENGAQGAIQLGNFTIKVDPPPQSETNVNNFVLSCFDSFDTGLNLDQFTQLPTTTHQFSRVSTESNPSVVVSNQNQKIFSNVYRAIQHCNEPLRDSIQAALQEDFEKILKPHFSVSESSNTRQSIDNQTLEGTQQDPLRSFLMSLLPQPQFTLKTQASQQIDFLYLYSQPLVNVTNNQKRVVTLLENAKEKEAIVDVLREEGGELKFLSMPARTDLFGEALDLNPLVLHYSGHGVHLEQSYLFFESLQGTVTLVSAQNLQLMLQKLQRKILFVFVSSCHSKLIGEVFQKAGAEHVICVNTRDKIMDEVCRVFSRAFYHALIRGKATVCNAFQIAKDQIKVEGRFPFSEENKFVLLKNETHFLEEHHCKQFSLPQGTFKDLTKIDKFNDNLPGHVSYFVGRQVLMQELIEKILNNKLCSLKGIVGIGKSAVLKEVGIYISERMIFRDGVLFVQMANIDSLDGLASLLYLKLLPDASPVLSKTEVKQLIITQLVQTFRGLEILLLLDNCDSLMYSADQEAFLDFLEIVLANSNKVHFCLSGRNDIYVNGIPCKTIKVEGISNEDAVTLLMSYAQRELPRAEVEELVDHISDNIFGDRILIQKLAGHQIMSILDGHPQAIILSASLLDRYSLKELYQELSNNQIIDFPVSGMYTSEEQQTLQVSLNLSWNNLLDVHEKAAQFFSVLGLLPNGASAEELENIWGQGWERQKNILHKSSLVTQHKKNNRVYYQLYPFMKKFAASKLEGKAFRHYHFQIIKYFTKKLQNLHQTIGTQIGESNQQIDVYLIIEPNVKAAIIRELELSGQMDSDAFYNFDSAASGSKIEKGKLPLKRQKSEQTEDDDDRENNFTLPLTKENLKIVQQRYESQQKSQSQNSTNFKFLTNSVYSHQTFKHFDQSSDEPRKSTVTEQAHRRKSMSVYQTHITISEENVEDNEISEHSEIDLDLQGNNQPPNPEEILNSNLDSELNMIPDKKPRKSIMLEAPPIKKNKKLKFEDKVQERSHSQDKKTKPMIATSRVRSAKKLTEKMAEKKQMDTFTDLKKRKVQQLIMFNCSILFFIRRYHECLKIIQWTIQCLVQEEDRLYKANLLKLRASVFFMQKEHIKAVQYFKEAEELFIKKGCMLGVGSCQAAIGYIYFQDREFNQAKISFENALYFYEELQHDFGRHFLNRWLALVKNKISSLKNDRLKHNQEEKQLIDNLKQEFKRGIKIDNLIHKKHKGGVFTLRWLGDTISLFVEQAWVVDSKQKSIMNFMKNPLPPKQKKGGFIVKEFESSGDQTETSNVSIMKPLSTSSPISTGPYVKKSTPSLNSKKRVAIQESIASQSQKQTLNLIAEVEDKSDDETQLKSTQKQIQRRKTEVEQKVKKQKLPLMVSAKIMPCFKKSNSQFKKNE